MTEHTPTTIHLSQCYMECSQEAWLFTGLLKAQFPNSGHIARLPVSGHTGPVWEQQAGDYHVLGRGQVTSALPGDQSSSSFQDVFAHRSLFIGFPASRSCWGSKENSKDQIHIPCGLCCVGGETHRSTGDGPTDCHPNTAIWFSPSPPPLLHNFFTQAPPSLCSNAHFSGAISRILSLCREREGLSSW